jgi:hypothetical protein
MAYLTQILRSVFGMELGLDVSDNLVLGGHKIYYNHRTGTDGVVDLGAIPVGAAGLGAAVAFAPASGTIDPSIAGFTAGLGSVGTGRINVTLAGNTSFEGLPAGVDGQQLQILVVSGNFTLTLLVDNESTAQKEILGSNNLAAALGDALTLYYDASLDGGAGMWVLTP